MSAAFSPDPVLLLLDDDLLRPRSGDPIGPVQVGLVLGSPFMATLLAAMGAASPAVAVPVAYVAAAGGAGALFWTRRRREEAAWNAWAEAFRARRPAVLEAVAVSTYCEGYRTGEALGQRLVRMSHQVPSLPPGVGAPGQPHAAQVVLWVADELHAAPGGVRRGLRAVERALAERMTADAA